MHFLMKFLTITKSDFCQIFDHLPSQNLNSRDVNFTLTFLFFLRIFNLYEVRKFHLVLCTQALFDANHRRVTGWRLHVVSVVCLEWHLTKWATQKRWLKIRKFIILLPPHLMIMILRNSIWLLVSYHYCFSKPSTYMSVRGEQTPSKKFLSRTEVRHSNNR